MDLRYQAYGDAPPPPFYGTTQRFSYAPFPPSVYYGRYPPPPYDAPPSDHGYFYSRPFRARMLDYVPWGEESATGHYSFLPYRPPKDPFLERGYGRERTREEVLREDVLREVVRRDHYSFLPYRPPKDHFLEREYERERIREEVLREEVRRRIIEEEELKVAETCGSKRKSDFISALPTPASTSNHSDKVAPKIVKKQKVHGKEYSCTFCQIIVNDHRTWLEHLNGKRHQNMLKNIANVEMSKKELLKVAVTCGSKRKSDSISALSTSAATGSSSNKAGRRKAKKQKILKKEYSCTFCQLTANTNQAWLFHLNGKRHRNMLKKLTNVDMTKKVSSDTDNKSTPGVALPAVKVEMDNGDSLDTKPAEELQTDRGIVKKMQVGREVHEVVEKNNRLWCFRCQYNCNTVVMMTIHLISEKHKGNCQKQ